MRKLNSCILILLFTLFLCGCKKTKQDKDDTFDSAEDYHSWQYNKATKGSTSN